MDAVKIPFGQSFAYHIKNARLRTQILEQLQTRYKFHPMRLFEKSYSDKLLSPLMSPETISCFVSNGTRWIIYIYTQVKERYCVLISVHPGGLEQGLPKMICLPVRFQGEQDYIAWGELVQEKDQTQGAPHWKRNANSKWCFWIESVLVEQGRWKATNQQPITEMVRLLQRFVQNWLPQQTDPFTFQTKSFCSLRQVETELAKCPFPPIGIRFYNLRLPVVFYFHTSNYQQLDISLDPLPSMNQLNELTEKDRMKLEADAIEPLVDPNAELNWEECELVVSIRPAQTYGIYQVFVWKRDVAIVVGESRIPTIELQQELYKLFKKAEHCRVLAKYHVHFKRFEIIRVIQESQEGALFVDSTVEWIQDLQAKAKLIPKPSYLEE